jgi:plasmid maintenance system antidote protein VapI
MKADNMPKDPHRLFRELKKLSGVKSMSKLAAEIGIQPSAIYHILAGDHNIGDSIVIKICFRFNVTPQWVYEMAGK